MDAQAKKPTSCFMTKGQHARQGGWFVMFKNIDEDGSGQGHTKMHAHTPCTLPSVHC